MRRVTLDPGDLVRANETTLAVLEPTAPDLLDARALAAADARVRAAESAVRQAQTATEQARLAYDHAENELTRVTDAFERKAANEHELDTARTEQRTRSEQYRAARIGEEIATFELDVARSALLYARGESDGDHGTRMLLQSPIDGAVLRVIQESMAVVAPGAPLLEVGDPRDLEIVIDVLSSDAVRVAPGQSVIIERWGGALPLHARVRRVEPSAFTDISALGIEEQRVNVIADFTSPPEDRPTLGDGYRVEAKIVTWHHDAVLQIPTSAAFRRGDDWAVYAIENDVARVRRVTLGQRTARTVEVTDGLDAGTDVVLHPNDQLHDGATIARRAAPSAIGQ